MLYVGFVSCGLVVLLADVAIKRGHHAYSQDGLRTLFHVAAAVAAAGAAAALALLRRHWARLQAAGPPPRAAPLRLPGGTSRARRLPWLGRCPSSGRQLIGLGLPSMDDDPRGHPGAAAPGTWPVLRTPSLGPGSSALRHRWDAGGGGGGGSVGMTDAASGLPADGRGGGGMPCTTTTAAAAAVADGAAIIQLAGGGGDPAAQSAGQHVALGRTGGRADRRLGCLSSARRLGAISRRIWPAALALTLSVSSSMALFPLFTYVPSSGMLGEALPEVRYIMGGVCHWHIADGMHALLGLPCAKGDHGVT